MTGEIIRDLLGPLIGKSGSIAMVTRGIGPIGFVTAENKKLTGVEIRADGLVYLGRNMVSRCNEFCESPDVFRGR